MEKETTKWEHTIYIKNKNEKRRLYEKQEWNGNTIWEFKMKKEKEKKLVLISQFYNLQVKKYLIVTHTRLGSDPKKFPLRYKASTKAINLSSYCKIKSHET